MSRESEIILMIIFIISMGTVVFFLTMYMIYVAELGEMEMTIAIFIGILMAGACFMAFYPMIKAIMEDGIDSRTIANGREKSLSITIDEDGIKIEKKNIIYPQNSDKNKPLSSGNDRKTIEQDERPIPMPVCTYIGGNCFLKTFDNEDYSYNELFRKIRDNNHRFHG